MSFLLEAVELEISNHRATLICVNAYMLGLRPTMKMHGSPVDPNIIIFYTFKLISGHLYPISQRLNQLAYLLQESGRCAVATPRE